MVDNKERRCLFERIYAQNDENPKTQNTKWQLENFSLYFSITEFGKCDCGRTEHRIWTRNTLFDSARRQAD